VPTLPETKPYTIPATPNPIPIVPRKIPGGGEGIHGLRPRGDKRARGWQRGAKVQIGLRPVQKCKGCRRRLRLHRVGSGLRTDLGVRSSIAGRRGDLRSAANGRDAVAPLPERQLGWHAVPTLPETKPYTIPATPNPIAIVPLKLNLAEGKGLAALRLGLTPQSYGLPVRPYGLTEPKGSHPF